MHQHFYGMKKKMKIPKSLQIAGQKWKVMHGIEDSNNMGETDYLKNIIYLDSRLPQTQKESVLFHEIICHTLGTTFANEKNGHALLDHLSAQIYATLKDNKFIK